MPEEVTEEATEVEEDTIEFDAAFEAHAANSDNDRIEAATGEVAAENDEVVEDDVQAKTEIPGEVGTDEESENDFESSFDRAAGGDSPIAENPQEDEETELDRTKAEVERLKHADVSNRGRVAALNRKLLEQKAAVKPQETQEDERGTDDAEDDESDWEEVSREFPEFASIVDKRMASVDRKVAEVAGRVEAVSTTQNTLVDDKITSYQETQMSDLRLDHGDLDQVIASPDFAQWKKDAPEEVQQQLKSFDAVDASQVLSTFKEETGWKSTGIPKEKVDPQKSDVEKLLEKRSKNLMSSAGIQSKNVGKSFDKGEESNDFASAFDNASRKKDKNRQRRY